MFGQTQQQPQTSLFGLTSGGSIRYGSSTFSQTQQQQPAGFGSTTSGFGNVLLPKLTPGPTFPAATEAHFRNSFSSRRATRLDRPPLYAFCFRSCCNRTCEYCWGIRSKFRAFLLMQLTKICQLINLIFCRTS